MACMFFGRLKNMQAIVAGTTCLGQIAWIDRDTPNR